MQPSTACSQASGAGAAGVGAAGGAGGAGAVFLFYHGPLKLRDLVTLKTRIPGAAPLMW